jgi:transposase InsO family protein
MGFVEVTRMQSRQQLAVWVLLEGLGLSEAARRAGVSRPTAYLWVSRAREQGIGCLGEQSRRPLTQPRLCAPAIEAAVVAQRRAHPCWGAKKIHALLWPDASAAEVCVRTVDRILSRHGLVVSAHPSRRLCPDEPLQRFERTACKELWQIDYKGLGRGAFKLGYSVVSIIDDHSRYCMTLEAFAERTAASVWAAVWRVLQEHGLPERFLCDNGDGFNSTASAGPTRFQANCWLLGIKTCHGRPYHPQTQGKVERFHGTIERELGAQLIQPGSSEAVSACCAAWRRAYNWERPHEALQMRVPGSIYAKSQRACPTAMPAHEPADGAITRKADKIGRISYKGDAYLVGHALAGEHVEVHPGQDALVCRYAGVEFRPNKV